MDTYEPLVCDIVSSYSKPISQYWQYTEGITSMDGVRRIVLLDHEPKLVILYKDRTRTSINTPMNATPDEKQQILKSAIAHLLRYDEYISTLNTDKP